MVGHSQFYHTDAVAAEALPLYPNPSKLAASMTPAKYLVTVAQEE